MAISKLLLVLVVTFAVVTRCASQTTQLDQGLSQELGNKDGDNTRMGNCLLHGVVMMLVFVAGTRHVSVVTNSRKLLSSVDAESPSMDAEGSMPDIEEFLMDGVDVEEE